ncbi:hypothetical protein [Sphaerimonospora mesophila]|uniref:hypothetical protein n=1 Tax=Sphaerimonospora mesophila TaxID=37483 RepID=UPI000A79A899
MNVIPLLGFLLTPITWVIIAFPRVRRVLARHRVLVAVTMLPIQPGAAVALIHSASFSLRELDVYWEDILFVVAAYLNGLVAFLVVVHLQENVARMRARSAPSPGRPDDEPAIRRTNSSI